jgi:hypothetical protein
VIRIMLAVATLLAVLDSIAAGVDVLEAALGVVGNEPGTVSFAAASNRDTLSALDDATVQTDLTPIFALRARLLRGSSLYPSMQGGMIQRALDKHYGAEGNGSLNEFLSNQDARVHPNLRLIGMQIDQRNVFAPIAVDPAARYEGTGAGTGTFVAGFDIDTTQFGKAALEVYVEVMGASTRTIRISVKNFSGSIETRDVVVPLNSAAGTVIPVGAGADRFIGVTAITTIDGGGTAADRLRVRSKVERVIAL